jgi:hypothetical protein
MKKWLCCLFFGGFCLPLTAQQLESNNTYLRYRGTIRLQPWVTAEDGMDIVRNWFPSFYPDKKFLLVKYDSANHSLEIRRSFVISLPNCQKVMEKGIVTYRLFFQALQGEVRYSMYSISHRQFRSDDEILQERIERRQAADEAIAIYWSTVPALAGVTAAAASNNEAKFVDGAVGAAVLFGAVATVAILANSTSETNYLRLGYLKNDLTTDNVPCGTRRKNDTVYHRVFSEVAEEHNNLSQSLQQFIRSVMPQFDPLELSSSKAKRGSELQKRDFSSPTVFDGDTLKSRTKLLTEKEQLPFSPAAPVPFFVPSWSTENPVNVTTPKN